MVELVGELLLIALTGSLGVPALMLALSRLGYFPPIVVDVFGHRWEFEPKTRYVFEPHANTTITEIDGPLKTAARVAVVVAHDKAIIHASSLMDVYSNLAPLFPDRLVYGPGPRASNTYVYEYPLTATISH